MTTASSSALSINPATGQQLAAYAFESREQLEASLGRAATGFAQWKRRSPAERSEVIVRLAAELRADAEKLAAMITAEMGKPIAQARGEI